MAGKTIAAMVKRLRGANKGKWVKTYFPNQQRFKAAMARDASRIKPIGKMSGGAKGAEKSLKDRVKELNNDANTYYSRLKNLDKQGKSASDPIVKETVAKYQKAQSELAKVKKRQTDLAYRTSETVAKSIRDNKIRQAAEVVAQAKKQESLTKLLGTGLGSKQDKIFATEKAVQTARAKRKLAIAKEATPEIKKAKSQLRVAKNNLNAAEDSARFANSRTEAGRKIRDNLLKARRRFRNAERDLKSAASK